MAFDRRRMDALGGARLPSRDPPTARAGGQDGQHKTCIRAPRQKGRVPTTHKGRSTWDYANLKSTPAAAAISCGCHLGYGVWNCRVMNLGGGIRRCRHRRCRGRRWVGAGPTSRRHAAHDAPIDLARRHALMARAGCLCKREDEVGTTSEGNKSVPRTTTRPHAQHFAETAWGRPKAKKAKEEEGRVRRE